MSINKYQKHVLVLPEDDANREIANGFLLNPELNVRRIQILTSAGGWTKAFSKFTDHHLSAMRNYPKRRIIILIDQDNNPERIGDFQKKIPDDIKNRVFIIGAMTEPEDLKKSTACLSFEEIGKTLARDCINGSDIIWGHDQLKGNSNELARLVADVKPFLFQ